MRRITVLFASMVVLVMCGAVFAQAGDYVGSERCADCHMDKFNDWKTSGHPYKLRPVEVAKLDALPVPDGYTWDDISYVIGGYRWKARFIDKQGYIITAGKKGEPLATQWNIKSDTWVNYHPGEKKPYKCGPCHMTAYSPEGNQDGLEGLIGTWQAPGIHCEECHGPGDKHVKSEDASDIKIDKTAAGCGKCHIRGVKEKIPAKKGFIRHHEQYNEYLASPHAGKLQCTDCHDPHKPARSGVKVACVSCHKDQGEAYGGSLMARSGVTCVDCHMPRASKSAEKLSPREGDVRTHNWKISTDPKASMFTEDGKYATGILTLDVVCLNCHGGRDIEWAASKVGMVHKTK